MSKSAETSFVNDENHPNQRDFRIKIQGKSLSNTPVASSKGHTDIVSERRPSFHFEDTISCIRSQDLDRNSLVAALHNHHLNVTSALHYDDIGSQVLQKSISKSMNKSDSDMNKIEDIDLEDTTHHTLSKIDTSANNSSSVIVSTSESPSIEHSVSPNVKPFKSMSSSRSSSPITVRRKSSFLQTVTSVILGTFSRGTSPRASPNGTPRQSAKSPVINTNDHLKTSTSVTTDDGWKVMSSPEESNIHSSDSSEEFKDTAVFPTPDNDFQGSDLPGKPPKHGRNSKTSLSINTNISVSRRQSIDSALGSNDGSELDSPSSGRASVSSLYNYKARRRSTLEALGWVNRPNSPSTTNNDVLRRLNGTGSVSSSVAGDSPKAHQQRSGEGLAARLRAEVLQPMSHSPNSTQRIIAALSLDSDLGHISLDNSPRNSTLSLSYTGTPRESALSAEEEAATNRLKNGIHRMQSRVTDTTLTQFNPYGLLTDDDVIISGDNTAKPGTWEFFSTRERPLCMAHQAVEERRKELLMSLPTLLVRNRTISFPHSSEVQLDSPIWEHYNMIAQPRDQVGSASVDTADDNDDDGVSLASLGSTYLPRGGLQRPSHVGTDNLSEHDLHSGIAFYGSAARRTRHGFYALVWLVNISAT